MPPAFALDLPPPPSYWSTERIVGWSLLGAAAAATGFALYFGSQRQEARDQSRRLEGDGPLMAEELSELEDDHDRATTGMFAASAAAVGLATFGVTYLILGGKSESELDARPELAVGPVGAQVGFAGRF